MLSTLRIMQLEATCQAWQGAVVEECELAALEENNPWMGLPNSLYLGASQLALVRWVSMTMSIIGKIMLVLDVLLLVQFALKKYLHSYTEILC